MISDRDLIIGLYEALGRLAKRLTGESIGIRIVDSETGKKFRTRTPTEHSYWVKDDEESAASKSGNRPVSDVSLNCQADGKADTARNVSVLAPATASTEKVQRHRGRPQPQTPQKHLDRPRAISEKRQGKRHMQ